MPCHVGMRYGRNDFRGGEHRGDRRRAVRGVFHDDGRQGTASAGPGVILIMARKTPPAKSRISRTAKVF